VGGVGGCVGCAMGVGSPKTGHESVGRRVGWCGCAIFARSVRRGVRVGGGGVFGCGWCGEEGECGVYRTCLVGFQKQKRKKNTKKKTKKNKKHKPRKKQKKKHRH